MANYLQICQELANLGTNLKPYVQNQPSGSQLVFRFVTLDVPKFVQKIAQPSGSQLVFQIRVP